MTGPSEKNRALAWRWREQLGGAGAISVFAYYNDDESMRVDIFSAVDAPHSGVTTYATLGLSDVDNELPGGRNAPTELVAVATSGSDLPARVLATISFDHVNPGLLLYPDLVVPTAISRNDPDASLPHAVLTDPFLWAELGRIEVEEFLVYPLLVVPVSEEELRFAEDRGAASLQALFDDQQINVFDWDRPSVA